MITTTNPRTGVSFPIDVDVTSDADVALITERSRDAAPALSAMDRGDRARLLDGIAQRLDEQRELLVDTAEAETGLGFPRLNAELSRSIFQFRLFADSVREGSYLEAIIDHAGETVLGPGPDLRRMLIPLGPVAVFGASNFPFAFSVLGGDTASALAAGCPVVLKAHSSHPLTSLYSFEAISTAARSFDAPEGTLGIVFGQTAGSRLVADPRIKAVSLTGSLHAAQALQEIINKRKEPIPLYGELSSLNPLVVTKGAAVTRADSIAEGLFASFTASGGQLCTKPGIAFVPSGAAGEKIMDGLLQRVAKASGSVMLNERIRDAFEKISARLQSGGAAIAARAEIVGESTGFVAPPILLTIDAGDVTAAVAEECFGPLLVVARYESTHELVGALQRMPKSLTSTVHADEDEDEDGLLSELTRELIPLSGRLVYNGFPTGVRVSWAQHHGGPWPSTNSNHTSVGVTATRRFLRPFVWQDAPDHLLPKELREGPIDIPRRIDGILHLASPSR